MLGDVDVQQSARTWLTLRPPQLPTIASWDVSHDFIVRPPKGITHVVLDTPAGLSGHRLDAVLKIADQVIVPLQPSIFDIHATHAFVNELLAHKHHDKFSVGIVGMRTRDGTIAADQLRNFLGTVDVPVITYLRDTQNYVQLAARGLTLWDVGPSRVERDLAQWQPLLQWITT
jgi:chromosome partitioning protein